MMQKQTALGGVQLLIVLFCIWCGEGAGEVKVKTVGPVARAACGAKQVEQCSFVDRFRTFDTKRWEKSANYENGSPFASWWAASAAFVNPATQTLNLAITLAFNPDVFSRYASGEVKSTGRYRYGCYEARIRPNTQPGVITSFFIYTDEYNAAPGRSKQRTSINLGFLYQPSRRRVSYRVTFLRRNTQLGPIRDIYPRFDVSKAFHNYGFKFTPSRITWYLDGRPVFSTTRNIPKLSDGPFRIFMNTYPVEETAGFAGRFVFKPRQTSKFAAVRYTRGINCRFRKSF